MRTKLVLGIADGWLSADGTIIYRAKDLSHSSASNGSFDAIRPELRPRLHCCGRRRFDEGTGGCQRGAPVQRRQRAIHREHVGCGGGEARLDLGRHRRSKDERQLGAPPGIGRDQASQIWIEPAEEKLGC